MVMVDDHCLAGVQRRLDDALSGRLYLLVSPEQVRRLDMAISEGPF